MRSFWIAAVVCGIAAAQAQSADTVKQVLTNRLMALKPAAAYWIVCCRRGFIRRTRFIWGVRR
jgi:hypothetical protein